MDFLKVLDNFKTEMLDILHEKIKHMLGNQLQTHLIPQHGMPYLHPPLINQNLQTANQMRMIAPQI